VLALASLNLALSAGSLLIVAVACVWLFERAFELRLVS
jgi:hypothetical protein